MSTHLRQSKEGIINFSPLFSSGIALHSLNCATGFNTIVSERCCVNPLNLFLPIQLIPLFSYPRVTKNCDAIRGARWVHQQLKGLRHWCKPRVFQSISAPTIAKIVCARAAQIIVADGWVVFSEGREWPALHTNNARGEKLFFGGGGGEGGATW